MARRTITDPAEMMAAIKQHVFEATHIEPWLERAETAALAELAKHRGKITVGVDDVRMKPIFTEQSTAEFPYPLPEKPTAKVKTAHAIMWSVYMVRDAITKGHTGVACFNCFLLSRQLTGFGFAPMIDRLANDYERLERFTTPKKETGKANRETVRKLYDQLSRKRPKPQSKSIMMAITKETGLSRRTIYRHLRQDQKTI